LNIKNVKTVSEIASNLEVNLFSNLNYEANLFLFDVLGHKLYETTFKIKDINTRILIPKPIAGLYFVLIKGVEKNLYQKIAVN
jgi:hypothetical protein